MTMHDILAQIANDDNADNIRLNDGAVTWDIDNLQDALADGNFDFDADVWRMDDVGIRKINDDGYLAGVYAWTFE